MVTVIEIEVMNFNEVMNPKIQKQAQQVGFVTFRYTEHLFHADWLGSYFQANAWLKEKGKTK